MRVALVLAVLALLPTVGAQTLTNPIQGPFEDLYVVGGRAVDGSGHPIVGGRLTVYLDARNVQAAPFVVGTNCYGDFIATFDIREIPASAKATFVLEGAAGGVSNAQGSVALDPFFRRSDLTIQAEGVWNKECADQQTTHWPGRVTVTGRVVNRTEVYVRNGTDYHALPYRGVMGVRFWDSTGVSHCPPSSTGSCEVVTTDERGDFRYSFTFPGDKDARGRMEILVNGQSFNATVDPLARMAWAHVELTGRGAPAPTPGAGMALTLAGIVAVALALRRR